MSLDPTNNPQSNPEFNFNSEDLPRLPAKTSEEIFERLQDYIADTFHVAILRRGLSIDQVATKLAASLKSPVPAIRSEVILLLEGIQPFNTKMVKLLACALDTTDEIIYRAALFLKSEL